MMKIEEVTLKYLHYSDNLKWYIFAPQVVFSRDAEIFMGAKPHPNF